MVQDTVAADGTYTFADNAAQYTTMLVEMPYTGNESFKRMDHLLTISNPSTETALTVDVFNVVDDLGGMDALARIDTFSVTAKDAHVDPTKVYYYDASAVTYTDDTTDFNDADANDVAVPGHASGEVGDFLLIGHTIPFNQLYLNIGTKKTDVSGFIAEYWNGTAWTELDTDVDPDTLFETATGLNILQWTVPSDWSNSITLNAGSGGGDNPTDNIYYMRIKCDTFTSDAAQGLITQGKISTIIANDVVQRKITGLYHGTTRVVITLNNATAVGANKLITGAGGFSGDVRISAI